MSIDEAITQLSSLKQELGGDAELKVRNSDFDVDIEEVFAETPRVGTPYAVIS